MKCGSVVGWFLTGVLVSGCHGKAVPEAGRPSGDVKPKQPAPSPPAAEQWRRVTAIELQGTVQAWEPEQSEVAGGPARSLGRSTFTLREDLASGQASIAWSRAVKYPFERSYDYVNVLNAETGEIRGVDSWSVKPPGAPHAMSRDHFAATWRQIHQLSPLGYLNGRAPELEAELDPVTKLPVRLTSHDADSVAGDSTLEVVLSEFKAEAELLMAHKLAFMLNRQTLQEVSIERVTLNPAHAGAPAPTLPLLQSDPSNGPVPFEWVLRREAMGGYSDTDSIYAQHLQTVSAGVELVAGRSHNALIVDLGKDLVVVDAPLNDAYGSWILKACREKFPSKPIRALVLTHHHNDHVGGARAFVSANIQVLVGKGNRQHFEAMFAAPHTLDRDSLQRVPQPARVAEVDEAQTLTGNERSLQLVRIPNHHAQGMLIAFLPKERIAFVADLWSPERDELRAPLTFERHRELVSALRAAKITPKLVVGGHGSVGNYAELATAVDAGPAPQASK